MKYNYKSDYGIECQKVVVTQDDALEVAVDFVILSKESGFGEPQLVIVCKQKPQRISRNNSVIFRKIFAYAERVGKLNFHERKCSWVIPCYSGIRSSYKNELRVNFSIKHTLALNNLSRDVFVYEVSSGNIVTGLCDLCRNITTCFVDGIVTYSGMGGEECLGFFYNETNPIDEISDKEYFEKLEDLTGFTEE